MIFHFLGWPLAAMIAALALAVFFPGEARAWLLPAVRFVALVSVVTIAVAAAVEYL